MDHPFFSVVIPCYNSESYIEQTLESILNQSFGDFEVVMVDDHSTDRSLKIACDYFTRHALKGKCVLRNAEKYPKGVSGCRNQGIDLAAGEWVCFLDSDDLFYEEKLLKTYNRIAENPEVKAFHHAVTEFRDTTGETIKDVVLDDLKGVHSKLPVLLDFNNICTSAVTIKKSLLLELYKFNVTLFGIEDYYCWLSISKQTQWYYDISILTRYRVREESLMGFKPLKHYITQNTNLLKVVGADNRFTQSDLQRLQKHLIYNVMSYYTNNSYMKFGFWNTHLGLLGLLRNGYWGAYTSIAYRWSKNLLMKALLGTR